MSRPQGLDDRREMRNPTTLKNIESLDVRYDVVENFKRQAKHALVGGVEQFKKLDFNHLRIMDRHRLCRILKGHLTCTNRLATRFYGPFQIRHTSQSTLPLTLGQIQSEAETSLYQANSSGIAGTSEGASQDIVVCGWIKTVRRQKHVAFLNLSDGTESNLRKGFQIVIEEPSLLETLKS